MARRRGARRLTHPTGIARPLDGVADVGPSEEKPTESARAPVTSAPGESLEERQERWYRERDRYERRKASDTAPKA
jgi:hypothetical protein